MLLQCRNVAPTVSCSPTSESCSPKHLCKAVAPKRLPKPAPQSCPNDAPQSCGSSKLPCTAAPQSFSQKLFPCAAPQSCCPNAAESCSPKLLLPKAASCSGKLSKVAPKCCCPKLFPGAAPQSCAPKLFSKAVALKLRFCKPVHQNGSPKQILQSGS